MPNESKGVIYINGAETFEKLAKKVKELPNEVIAKGADLLLAETGAKSRSVIGKKHEQEISIGTTQFKSYKRQTVVRKSNFDASHGWYKATDGRRIIGFKYENVAYQRGSKGNTATRLNMFSKGYVYSLINNLWGHDTKPYKKQSPLFRRVGEFKSGRWRAGDVRKGRITFEDNQVKSVIGYAISKAEPKIEDLLVKGGWK